jgi:hypothetical protein
VARSALRRIQLNVAQAVCRLEDTYAVHLFTNAYAHNIAWANITVHVSTLTKIVKRSGQKL